MGLVRFLAVEELLKSTCGLAQGVDLVQDPLNLPILRVNFLTRLVTVQEKRGNWSGSNAAAVCDQMVGLQCSHEHFRWCFEGICHTPEGE